MNENEHIGIAITKRVACPFCGSECAPVRIGISPTAIDWVCAKCSDECPPCDSIDEDGICRKCGAEHTVRITGSFAI